jgi:hypothetical protein
MIFALPYDPSSIRIFLLMACVPILLWALRLLRLSGERDGNCLPARAYVKAEKRKNFRQKSGLVFDLDDGMGHYAAGNARLVDLSLRGAHITSAVSLQAEQRVRGRIHSSVEGRLEIVGNIVWSKLIGAATHYGIEFEKVTRRPT